MIWRMDLRVVRLICILIICFSNQSNIMAQIVLPKSEHIKFLALGDSYTIGESVSESERWPEQLATDLRSKGFQMEKPQIIATTGWRTDQLKQAIVEQNPGNGFGLVSLLIGVNNQYQKKPIEIYVREFEELLKIAIYCAGGRKEGVLVVSIPDYGYTPFGESRLPEVSRELDQYNSINRDFASRYGVPYFNITDISRRGLAEPDLVAADKLHPSGKMYRLWVAEILKGFK